MMLAGARQRGLVVLRNGASRACSLDPPSHSSAFQRKTIIRSILSTSPGALVEDSKDPSPPWPQQQTRVYHELPPSRRLKLKVPVKKGIIRAKSSATAATMASVPAFDLAEAPATAAAALPKPKRVSSRRRILDQLGMPDFELPNESNMTFEQESFAATSTDGESSSPISIVEAVYAAKTIDLAPLIISDFSKNAVRRKYNKDNLLLQLSPDSNKNNVIPSYVAVYRFGSIIFFNVSPRQKTKLLELVKRYATEPSASGFEQRDTFGVCVDPTTTTTQVTPEHCVVQQLDMNAVAVISEVMAQSVALDSYNEIVDSLLENFAVINSKISTTNTMDLDKKMLFSKIAQNNRIFIDLISKLRIKGRSQIAWDQGEYEVIHSGMTTEFDIDDRFELIQFKLDLIQQNSKLFLEVIHHQKAATVEWVIVVLIGFECTLMCLDMSGQGSVMFEYATRAIGWS